MHSIKFINFIWLYIFEYFRKQCLQYKLMFVELEEEFLIDFFFSFGYKVVRHLILITIYISYKLYVKQYKENINFMSVVYEN